MPVQKYLSNMNSMVVIMRGELGCLSGSKTTV